MIKLSGEVNESEVNESATADESVEAAVATQEPPEPEATEPDEEVADTEPASEVTTSPAPDPVTDHQLRISEASAEVASTAIAWSTAKEDSKQAKKDFDGAVGTLQRIITKGPERYPLLDQAEPAEPVEPPSCFPTLERGQVRVHLNKLGGDETDNQDAPQDGDIIVCTVDKDGDLTWRRTAEDGEIILDVDTGDSYEVMEEWPVSAEMPIVHQPPLHFGPDVETETQPTAPDHDPDAWRYNPIAELKITSKQIEKLEAEGVETIGEMEDFRAAISNGKKKWPKGIGEAAVTKIEDAILDWLRDNGPKPTE